MKRDTLGICLNTQVVVSNQSSTFTHIRGYDKFALCQNHTKVMITYPQMNGKQLLEAMESQDEIEWRAEFLCKDGHCH